MPKPIDFNQPESPSLFDFPDISTPQGGTNIPLPADITGAIPMEELEIPEVQGKPKWWGGYGDRPTPQQNPNFGAAVDRYMNPQQVPDIFGQQPSIPQASPQQSAPQAQPSMRDQVEGAMSGYGAQPPAGSETTQLPRGGSVTAPRGIAEAVEARRAEEEGKYPKGYTDEEKRRYDQEIGKGKIESAKRGIRERVAAKEIAKSLEEQGLSRDEINKAIGGDTAETLSNLKAMQAGRTPSAKGRVIDAKRRDSAVQGAKYNEDGTPKNREAKVAGYYDWADTTGSDPQGKSMRDAMTQGEWNQFKRDTGNLLQSRNEGLEKRLDGMVKRVTDRSERGYQKKQADIASAEMQREIDAETDKKEAARLKKLKDEADMLNKQLANKKLPKKDREEIDQRMKGINEAWKASQEPMSQIPPPPRGSIGVRKDKNGIPVEYYMNDGSIKGA